jgi:hypothetical protein
MANNATTPRDVFGVTATGRSRLKRRSALSVYAYASEFSDCRCGSTIRPHKSKKMGKGLDPDLPMIPPNPWSRLKPNPRSTLPVLPAKMPMAAPTMAATRLREGDPACHTAIRAGRCEAVDCFFIAVDGAQLSRRPNFKLATLFGPL